MTVTPPEPFNVPGASESVENKSKFFFMDFLHNALESYGAEQVSEWLDEFAKELKEALDKAKE